MKSVLKHWPAVAAGLCAVCAALILPDAIAPSWSLFLKPAVQWLIAAAALALIVSGAMLAHRDRKRLRRRMRRQRG